MLEDTNNLIQETTNKMNDSIESFNRHLTTVRTGKANPAILNKLTIEYYGTETLINQIASISVPEAQVIMIKPFDKSSLNAIEKAIHASDLGLTPNNNGDSVRLNIPSLTEEKRRSLVKDIQAMSEQAKVSVRNIRRHANEQISKIDGLSEDDIRSVEADIQKLTDKYIKKVEEISKDKEKEVQTI